MTPFVRDVNGMPCLFLSEADYARRVGECSCGASDVLLDTRGFCLECRGFDQAERLKAPISREEAIRRHPASGTAS